MATKVELAQMSDTMTEGVVLAWLKEEGDEVRQGDAIAEIETDKATMELEAPAAGVLLKRYVEAGATVSCGTVLALVGNRGEPIPDDEPTSAAAREASERVLPPSEPCASEAPAPYAPTEDVRLRSSPSARKLARMEGVDLRTVVGTGPGGRVVRRDVEAVLAEGRRAAPVAQPAHLPGQTTPISRVRRKMIERLVATHQTVPTFSITRRIRMDAARAFRESLKMTETFAGGIGYTELLVKAVARAMKSVPQLNARYTESAIVLLDEVNVGVAVGLEEGVIVPVIRRCQARSLREVRDEFQRITTWAKEHSLLADDLGNSTFTISNLGMYGVEEFTAILNAPDAAILAVGAVARQPVVSDDGIVVAEMMSVTLTVDHRVADGVLAARWLQAFTRCLENPVSLLVD